MLLTVKDACDPHPMALDYSMSEQVENLSDVIDATQTAARAFFEKNYVTKGMETLLTQGLKRLAGKSDQAVFELKQAMGGGKTHSMIALGLLARDPALRADIVPEIARDAVFGEAKLVAVNGARRNRGRTLGPPFRSRAFLPAHAGHRIRGSQKAR
jgi:hypothetical protein